MRLRPLSLAVASLSMVASGWTMAAELMDLAPPINLRLTEALSAPPIGPPAGIEPESTWTEPAPRAARRRKQAELNLTGSLSAWSGTRRLDSANAVAVPRLAGDLSVPLAPGFVLTASGDAAREQADKTFASRTTATLREGYLGYRQGRVSVRAGYQIISWGRIDVINPTDNVSARNYTRLVDTDADQKLGVPSLNLQYRIDSTSIQVIWQPVFRATTIPLPSVPGLRYHEDKPEETLDSGGVRIDTTGERLSWSLSYFRGPAKRPNLSLSLPEIAAGRITLDHPQVSIFGADAEWIAGHWAFRSETAYNRFSGSGSDPIASRESFVESVFGVERAFGQASAFLQADWRHTFDYVDPNAVSAPLVPLALANASVNEELYRQMLAIGGGFGLNTSDLRWSVSFDLAYVPAHGDVVVRPRLRYRCNDLLTFWAGVDYFDGPERGIYGRLGNNTVGFVGISGSLLQGR